MVHVLKFTAAGVVLRAKHARGMQVTIVRTCTYLVPAHHSACDVAHVVSESPLHLSTPEDLLA